MLLHLLRKQNVLESSIMHKWRYPSVQFLKHLIILNQLHPSKLTTPLLKALSMTIFIKNVLSHGTCAITSSVINPLSNNSMYFGKLAKQIMLTIILNIMLHHTIVTSDRNRNMWGINSLILLYSYLNLNPRFNLTLRRSSSGLRGCVSKYVTSYGHETSKVTSPLMSHFTVIFLHTQTHTIFIFKYCTQWILHKYHKVVVTLSLFWIQKIYFVVSIELINKLR